MTLATPISGQVKIVALIAALLVSSPLQARAQDVCGGRDAERQQLAYGGHDFDRPTDMFQDSDEALALSAAPLLGRNFSSVDEEISCGRGRYRNAATGKCLGPADAIPCR